MEECVHCRTKMRGPFDAVFSDGTDAKEWRCDTCPFRTLRPAKRRKTKELH